MCQRVRDDNLITCFCKKQNSGQFLMSPLLMCSVIDNELHHDIAKVVCRSNQLSPHGSTVSMTML